MKIGITERGDAALHFDEWYQKRHTVDGIILVTKNPELLHNRLKALDKIDFKFVIHCTITGFGASCIEPGVVGSSTMLFAYWHLRDWLVADYGDSDNLVLRVDPIIPRDLNCDNYADNLISKTMNTVSGGGRIRISFLDWYPHVQARFQEKAPAWYNLLNRLYEGKMHLPLEYRQEFKNRHYPYAEVCGEPGMECTGCISSRDLMAMKLDNPPIVGKSQQRKVCACLGVKTELLTHRGQCEHGCLYCYWK